MKVKFKGTRTYAVNLFSDFLLEQFSSDDKTIIQIADCQNFLVIKGKTSSDETLDLLKLKSDFVEKYSDFLPENFATHTIDLIDYSQKLKEPQFLNFDFFLSENPIFTKHQIKRIKYGSEISNKTSMIETSEFPHGFSLSMGRTLFYYSQHLINSIPPDFLFEHIKILIPSNFSEENFEVSVENETNDKLKSFFLDYFDFNYKNFEKKIKGHLFSSELNDPLLLPKFITDKPSDTIIV